MRRYSFWPRLSKYYVTLVRARGSEENLVQVYESEVFHCERTAWYLNFYFPRITMDTYLIRIFFAFSGECFDIKFCFLNYYIKRHVVIFACKNFYNRVKFCQHANSNSACIFIFKMYATLWKVCVYHRNILNGINLSIYN